MATTPPFFLALETKPVEPSEYRWEAVVGPPFGCASPAAHAELLRVRRGVRARARARAGAVGRQGRGDGHDPLAPARARPALDVTRRFYLHWKLQSVIDFIGSEPACPVKWALARADVSPPTQFKTEHAANGSARSGFPSTASSCSSGRPRGEGARSRNSERRCLPNRDATAASARALAPLAETAQRTCRRRFDESGRVRGRAVVREIRLAPLHGRMKLTPADTVRGHGRAPSCPALRSCRGRSLARGSFILRAPTIVPRSASHRPLGYFSRLLRMFWPS